MHTKLGHFTVNAFSPNVTKHSTLTQKFENEEKQSLVGLTSE